MQKVLNSFFLIFKFILLFLVLLLNVYIVLSMYHRIDKNILEAFPIFLPHILLLFILFINIIFKQDEINSNIFYNFTFCFGLACIIIVDVRAIFDKSMLLNEIMGYGINFSYFSDFIPFMNIIVYGLCISNICFMVSKNNSKLKKERKLEVL